MGKGSNPRPIEIPREEFRNNWDKIFGKKKAKPQPQPTDKKDTK
jgi:hypothetical protein